MKTFFCLLCISVLVFGCKTNEEATLESNSITLHLQEPQQNIFNSTYTSYKEFEVFENYEKVADTLIFANNFHPQYSLLTLREGNNSVILFNKFSIDINEGLIETTDYIERKLLDTLQLNNIATTDLVIAGCCTDNKKYAEEIIAIVEKTEELYIGKIKRAWRANLETGKIEEISNLAKVECMNDKHKVPLPEIALD